MYNGFHSHLPILNGNDIFILLGLHTTAMHEVKYDFDAVRFAPGVEFTPIALPIFCKAEECLASSEVVRDKNIEAIETFFSRDISEILTMCIGGDTSELDAIASLKLGLQPREYKVCMTWDHKFVFDEIAAMRPSWDWETSYELTLKHSDITPGPECHKLRDSALQLMDMAKTGLDSESKDKLLEILEDDKYYYIELDRIFMTHSQKQGGLHNDVTNLNPKHVGTYLYRSNEAYRGERLLAIYRHHADLLFQPEQKPQLLSFLNFHQTLRRRGWMLALPVFTGQEENYSEFAQLYRKMAEWSNIYN